MFDGLANTVPWGERRGCTETPVADRLLGLRDPAPDADAELGGATQITARRAHDGRNLDIDGHARIVVCEADLTPERWGDGREAME